MNCFVLELRALAPRQAAVSRLKKAPRHVVPVGADIQNFRIARIDDDVIDEQPRLAEIMKQLPVLTRVSRGIDLAVESAKVKAIGVRRIYYECSNVASRR